MCGKHKYGGYCCSYQPWQHAYCAVVNKGSPPWHNTILTPGGGVNSQQGQAGLSGNVAQSQHAAIPGTGQGHSGLRSQGLLGAALVGEAAIGPGGRAETGPCILGPSSTTRVINSEDHAVYCKAMSACQVCMLLCILAGR